VPAYATRQQIARPRERAYALAAVVVVQAALSFALLSGLKVNVTRPGEIAQHLIDINLPKPPPPPPPQPKPVQRSERPKAHAEAAPKAAPAKPGGSPGPKPSPAPPSVTPTVALKPSAAPSGGGPGSGPALGSGSGGGAGGNGYGEDGGTDLEQIAGEITSSDYPRNLREAGVGGRVSFVFKVEPNGRVGSCRVTRSSGVPELDALTCRLIQQRFVYRPSTDAQGRPIEDEVEGDHDWIANRH
jgi:protein TonB